jgi:DNA-binding transcriptional regulator YhcF (GntR family)
LAFTLIFDVAMKKPGIITQLAIDHFSATPKYLQLANSVIRAVAAGFLEAGTVMPSINELSYTFEISRDTAEKSYRHLKKTAYSVPCQAKAILYWQPSWRSH